MKLAAAMTASKPARRGVIITGGSSGIGLALATALLQNGGERYKVYVTGTRPLAETELAPLVRSIEASGSRSIHYSSGDTGDEPTVNRQFDEARTRLATCLKLERQPCLCATQAMKFFDGVPFFGLCINAGIGGGRYPLEEFDVERFDQMFRTNVRGVFLWLRASLPALKAGRQSQVVVTSSVMGSRPSAQAAPYCATKYAVNGLVLSLRAELKAGGHSHVKCGLVCPAGVATPWWEDAARGFAAAGAPSVDTSKFLAPRAVADACVAMLEQDASSNVESVMLDATG